MPYNDIYTNPYATKGLFVNMPQIQTQSPPQPRMSAPPGADTRVPGAQMYQGMVPQGASSYQSGQPQLPGLNLPPGMGQSGGAPAPFNNFGPMPMLGLGGGGQPPRSIDPYLGGGGGGETPVNLNWKPEGVPLMPPGGSFGGGGGETPVNLNWKPEGVPLMPPGGRFGGGGGGGTPGIINTWKDKGYIGQDGMVTLPWGQKVSLVDAMKMYYMDRQPTANEIPPWATMDVGKFSGVPLERWQQLPSDMRAWAQQMYDALRTTQYGNQLQGISNMQVRPQYFVNPR